MNNWDHKDVWHQPGPDFLVEVKRHSVKPSLFAPDEGPNRWAVYAYIYPAHNLFGGFSGPRIWQLAATALPLHGHPSYLRWHFGDDGKPCSVQVGADYHHLRDERFANYVTPGDAWEVFQDAENLFVYLARHPGTVAQEQR